MDCGSDAPSISLRVMRARSSVSYTYDTFAPLRLAGGVSASVVSLRVVFIRSSGSVT